MFESWTFGRKLGVGFAVAALALLVVATVGYQSTHRLIENDAQVDHTQQVRLRIADLLSLLKDAETGQRGYVITGRDDFLEPYRSALPNIDHAFQDLHELTLDNPAQQQRLTELRPLIDQKLSEMK